MASREPTAPREPPGDAPRMEAGERTAQSPRTQSSERTSCAGPAPSPRPSPPMPWRADLMWEAGVPRGARRQTRRSLPTRFPRQVCPQWDASRRRPCGCCAPRSAGVRCMPQTSMLTPMALEGPRFKQEHVGAQVCVAGCRGDVSGFVGVKLPAVWGSDARGSKENIAGRWAEREVGITTELQVAPWKVDGRLPAWNCRRPSKMSARVERFPCFWSSMLPAFAPQAFAHLDELERSGRPIAHRGSVELRGREIKAHRLGELERSGCDHQSEVSAPQTRHSRRTCLPRVVLEHRCRCFKPPGASKGHRLREF